jgi:hypothetical protein
MVASPSRGTTMPNDAIAYIRVSSEEQADSGLGMEAQRQRIVAYCSRQATSQPPSRQQTPRRREEEQGPSLTAPT